MAASREQHRHPELITGLNGLRIPETAAGMNHGRDAMLRSETDGVVKREESIAGQY